MHDKHQSGNSNTCSCMHRMYALNSHVFQTFFQKQKNKYQNNLFVSDLSVSDLYAETNVKIM